MNAVYCGPAPVPATLLASWNADPAAIALCCVLAGLLARRGADLRPLALGLGLFLLLFLSPLCALTAALFSARAVHHVLLVAAVAPLLALSLPARPGNRPILGMAPLVVLHAVLFWVWHAPALYDAAIRSSVLYWSMQLSLLGTGVLMWRAIFGAAQAGTALLGLLATIVQMGLLGALLTFARTPLYGAHATTTLAFGLDPLEDQQLAGLVMWVPAALPYLGVALWLLFARLGSARELGAR